jgi:hypothetical protein
MGATFEEGHPRACRACRAPLIGAMTAAGRVAPITMEAKENGNVLVFVDAEAVLQARTFTGEALAELRRQGVPLKLNHFADCPQAARFRPKK